MAQDGPRYNGRTKTKLVFNRYGDQYFLSQIWEEGNLMATQLTKTSAERKAAKDARSNIARSNGEPETVVIFAE
jgi:hypothetical protein